MTAQELATAVLVRINTVEGFADRLVVSPEDALHGADLLHRFAAIESPDAGGAGIVRSRVKFTQGWRCVANTKSYQCHG